MFDITLIRESPDRVRTAIRQKGLDAEALIDRILALDAERREAVSTLQDVRTQANAAARSIGDLMKAGRREEAQAHIAESSALKEQVKALEEEVRAVEPALEALLLEVPNVPHESVPVGTSPEDNVVLAEVGEKPSFAVEPQPHWVLTEALGLVDFERGAKVTGAGFPFYVGLGARLQRSLIQLFLDMATEEGGYQEIQPPLLVNAASALGTGNLPDKEGQMYEAERDGFYALPTAEVPVTNYHRDEILEAASLPIRYCAYTPCFRREAGSYGKDVRGLNRLHQFDKVELVQFVDPATSYEALEQLLADAERALQRLELPYRRLLMCTADMGFNQAKQYDLEVWSAGQSRWLEVSSVSNFEAFQARRASIRYRPKDGQKVEFVHTLNGSALALPRIMAALLENNQQPDGSVLVPEALRPYLRTDVLR
ncbi:MAG: serine--tRNA ligase [Bacteroidota bacterium]